MKFKSDDLDETCLSLKGHKNWAYLNTLPPESLKSALSDPNNTAVVFYGVPGDDEEEN